MAQAESEHTNPNPLGPNLEGEKWEAARDQCRVRPAQWNGGHQRLEGKRPRGARRKEGSWMQPRKKATEGVAEHRPGQWKGMKRNR